MPIPVFDSEGYLPPGLYNAALREVIDRFGGGSEARERQAELLKQVVAAAENYITIKRILVWGSFVTSKAEPNDLDYSFVASVEHRRADIAERHRRFFTPAVARMHYGVDQGYLVVMDYPLEKYIELLDFLCHTRKRRPYGVVEISVRGEFMGDRP
jgi:hypothetical protein